MTMSFRSVAGGVNSITHSPFWIMRPARGGMLLVAFLALEWLSSIHEFMSVPITPWNPGLGVVFAFMLLLGPIYALVLFAGLYLALEHSLIPGLLVTGLAITVRPDAVIVCLLFILALYLGRMASLRIALAVAAASLVLTLLVIGDLRLLREFLFTDADYSLSWNTMEMRHHYLTSVRMGLPTIWQTSALVFMTLGMTGLFLRRKNPRSGDLWSMLLVAAMASMIIRYLLHPVIEDRFMVTEYLLIIMGLCKTWQDLLKPPRMILP